MWNSRTMAGTSTASWAEWNTAAVRAEGDRLGPAREHEHDRPSVGDEGQRLVGRIEQEDPLHHASRLSGAPVAIR